MSQKIKDDKIPKSLTKLLQTEKDFKKRHDIFWKNRSGKPKDEEWTLDNGHPSKKSHEFMANELYKFIKEVKI